MPKGYWSQVFDQAVVLMSNGWPAEAAFKQARNIVDGVQPQGSLGLEV